MKKANNQAGHFHAVRFYDNKESLVRIVAEFLGEGIVLGQPAVAIGTQEHREGILAELRGRHFDVVTMQSDGDLLMLDAREMMSTFMVDGMPDPVLFKAAAGSVLERVRKPTVECTRAYGEMVDLLWKEGQTVAAVRLEMLWNQLALSHDFKLLCGYSMGNFYKDIGVGEICEQHSHVIAADGSHAPTKPGLGK